MLRPQPQHRCCCKPTANCNTSCDPADLLEKLCLHCKLHTALQHHGN